VTRPPLTLALTSVLAAVVDGADRPALLATLRPHFGRPVTARPARRRIETPGLARVIQLPRVIPMPGHHLGEGKLDERTEPDTEPDTAA
jgi:hypothetical protein